MAGALINSGTLEEYKPLGEQGHPVYSVAPQLREIIRIRVSAAAANCLAIPKINEDHSVIDWYAAEAGHVVPWSAATESERAFALENLDKIRTEVNSALASINGVSSQEKKNIEKLRDKVFIHPDNTCVSLVNGKAVLSFWGFYTNEAPPEDPFLKLRPVVATPATPAPTPQATAANGAFTTGPVNDAPPIQKSAGRPWWLWLLLALLALLLLFFLLRGCAPSVGVPTMGSADTTAARPPETSAPNDSGALAVDKSSGDRLDLALGAEGSSGSIDLAIPAIPDTNITVPSLPDLSIETTPNGDVNAALIDKSLQTEGDVTLLPDGQTVTEDNVMNTPATGDPMADSADSAQSAPPPTDLPLGAEPSADEPLTPAPLSEPQTPHATTALPSNGPDSPMQATTPTPGSLMRIPSGAAQSGSVSFMDGRWRASGGIQDARTGQPVRLFYDFKDGKGSVTVEKGDGARCRTAAESTMSNGNLVISNQGNTAQCSDGSTLALPKISCSPDANGQANCTGVAKDGSALPLIIRKQP